MLMLALFDHASPLALLNSYDMLSMGLGNLLTIIIYNNDLKK
jgi:hypothetical protein